MKYRKNLKNGEDLSILGYGCMRFPSDYELTKKQVIHAIENGINYFDTAYIYGGGKNEGILGRILEESGYRNKVKIATKLPPFMVKNIQDAEKIFQKQLERLRTDRIDYYLIHMLSDLNGWERLKNLGIIEWISNKKKEGKIINIGFSYHGGPVEFKKIIDDYNWEFCQIQYNYLDENNQAGKSGLLYAANKDIPVIIMEPLRGGSIVKDLPEEVNNIWRSHPSKRSAADWALRWIWNHKEVTSVLSGMNDMTQIEENIRIASEVEPLELSKEDLAQFSKAKAIISSKTKVNCTGCAYCMPCPKGVDIPNCFSLYNEKYAVKKGGSFIKYLQSTGAWSNKPSYASLCVKCGKCEKHCPQNIPIREKLDEVSSKMEGIFFKPVVKISKKIMNK